MPLYKCVAELAAANGLEADNVVNTFVVNANDVITQSNVGELTIALTKIYTTPEGTLNRSLGNHIGPQIDRAAQACKWSVYDITQHLDGSPHGSPVAIDAFTMPAPTAGSPLPNELAVVATLRAAAWDLQPIETPDNADADTVPQRPRQRYTGRNYFGPLTVNALAGLGADLQPRVVQNLRDAIGAGFTAAAADLFANAHFFGIWSRKDEVVRAIDAVQVDDAFDVQRRRGVLPSIRNTYDVLP